jgi:hypothetical protein
MGRWRKESFGLQIGDWIQWQDTSIQLGAGEDATTFIQKGMIGRVVSLRDGFPLEDPYAQIIGQEIPARALIQFENGHTFLIDSQVKFQKMLKQ